MTSDIITAAENTNKYFPEVSDELIEEQAFYQNVMYLPLPKLKIKKEWTIEKIIKQAKLEYPSLDKKSRKAIDDHIPGIEKMLNHNPEFKNAKINDISWFMNEDKYPPGGVQAVTFTLDNKVSVSYRGTPPGSWLDNAISLIKKSNRYKKGIYIDRYGNKFENLSPMEVKSIEYADEIREKYGGKEYDNYAFYTNGHSKGGVEAFLAMTFHSDFFTSAVGFDAKGISPEFFQEIEKIHGKEKLKEIRGNMYGINTNNDFVHILGTVLPSSSNRIWLKSSGGIPHAMISKLAPDGTIMDIDPEGPGVVARFTEVVINRVLELPDADRESVMMAGMLLAQLIQGEPEQLVNGEEIDWLHLAANFDKGIEILGDIVSDVIMYTEEGGEFAEFMIDLIDSEITATEASAMEKLEEIMKPIDTRIKNWISEINGLKGLVTDVTYSMISSLVHSVMEAVVEVVSSILVRAAQRISKAILNSELVEQLRSLLNRILNISLRFRDFINNTMEQLKILISETKRKLREILDVMVNLIEASLDWLKRTLSGKKTIEIGEQAILLTGAIGIDYTNTSNMVKNIDNLITDLNNYIINDINGIIDKFLSLKTTSIDTSSIYDVQRKIEKKITGYENYQRDLSQFQIKYEELEDGFEGVMQLNF